MACADDLTGTANTLVSISEEEAVAPLMGSISPAAELDGLERRESGGLDMSDGAPAHEGGVATDPEPMPASGQHQQRQSGAPAPTRNLDLDTSGQTTPKARGIGAASIERPALRKIWVKRPGASATIITVQEHDLVDDVRSSILLKYANSLGRHFDAPDICLRICAQKHSNARGVRGGGDPLPDRDLGPQELISDVLAAYYPDGQPVDDAILIDVPSLPGASPTALYGANPVILYPSSLDDRPPETGETYFPHTGPGNNLAPVYMQHGQPTHPAHPQQRQYPPLYQPHQHTHHQQFYHTHHHNSRPHVYTHHNAQAHHPRAASPATALPPSRNAHFEPGPQQHSLPSPGGGGGGGAVGGGGGGGGGGSMRLSKNYRERPERPRLGRTHTSSPGIMGLNPAAGGLSHSNATFSGHPSLAAARQQDYDLMNGVHNIGTVGVDDHFKHVANTVRNITLEDGRVPMIPGLPPPGPSPSTATTTRHTAKKSKKQMMMDAMEALPSTGVGHVVPPINVLIVEDNPINLKLLEAFVKKLKVRWKTAVNGQEAVSKWRQGGFHLVLMDIQLPVMNGLDATREIRRLERVNSIGIFTTPASGVVGSQTRQLLLLPGQVSEDDKPVEQDKLEKPEQFKSPVIIVALTASSLQSDRHEALAAGCNDFLTKPVNFDWLERKVTEWGCMQALIDFEGWRQWKELPTTGGGGGKMGARPASGIKSRTKKK